MAIGAALVGGAAAAQSPPTCQAGKTALVLSGGGAKGIAHIAVLRVLDSLGARPDLIVGTSMGSIIGALYASGHDSRAIDSIARELSPAELFARADPQSPRPWRPLRPLLVWVQGESGLALRSPGVDEPRTNGMLSAMLLRGNLLARGDFDSLPIPFRAVATNLATREPVVLDRGDLAQAVRASIAVPLVFPPEPVDSLLLTDGGLSANIPIAVARELGATRVIVSDVTGPLRPARNLSSPLEVAEQLAGFLFQQAPANLDSGDVYVKVDVRGFANLDFSPESLERLRQNGRLAADSVLPRAACLPRAPERPRPLPAGVEGFELNGGIRSDATVIERVLGIAAGNALDESELRIQLRHLTEVDTYDAFWLGPEGEGERVRFRSVVRRAPPRLAGVTVAYDNDLGGRLGAMYLDRHLLGTSYELSGVAGLSRIQTDLTFGLRRYFGYGRFRVAPALTARVAEEKIIRYSEAGEELGRPSTREAVFFAGLERELGGSWVVTVGGDARFWREADTTTARSGGETGRSGGVLIRMTGGLGLVHLSGEAVISGTFRRVQGELSGAAHLGRLTLAPSARLGWGQRLPLQNRFPLGGDEGFPGLAVEERRGDRELSAGLQAAWKLRDQVSLLLLLAGGRIADGGGLFEDDGWLGGLRTGIGLDTAIGPVRLEYGAASNGRDQLFVRIGRWF
ncbi:MAG TPA: patatin-like phospholipase family protein [Gemmatimonadales bacterium]